MEFASHKELSKKIDSVIYFAHPGCPWERGTNENTNGLIRQFFPKGMNLEGVSDDEVDLVMVLINNRPRKMFGYRTASEMMAKCMKKGLVTGFGLCAVAHESIVGALVADVGNIAMTGINARIVWQSFQLGE